MNFKNLSLGDGEAAAPECEAANAAEKRSQWAQLLKGAILFTAVAVKARDWARASQGEALIERARNNSGLDSALLVAVFGGEIPVADTSNRLLSACLNAGQTATDATVATAMAVVAANKEARDEASRLARDAARAVRATAAERERAESKDRRAAKAGTEGVTAGSVVTVRWTYRQAKLGVACTESGLVVECHGRLPGCGEGGGQAKVTRVGGRLPIVELI